MNGEDCVDGVKLQVGDIVVLKDKYDPAHLLNRKKRREKIIGVYPMNNLYPGFIDVACENEQGEWIRGGGHPVYWIERIVSSAGE